MLRIAFLILLTFPILTLGDLQQKVENIIKNASIGNGTVGVCLIDTQTGETIVNIRSTSTMIPASNQKLLTTGTAIHVLGPSFTFNTLLQSTGDDLIIIGDGDPTFGDPELLGVSQWKNENKILAREFEPWVQAVIKEGLTNIDTIYIDDRIFDRNFVHPSWPADQINNWYCAQVAGINYHLNVVHFFPSPNPGSRANLGNIAPKLDWMTIGNKTSSKTSKKDKSSFWVARTPNSNKLTARGNVKSTHQEPVKIAFHDPPIIFGESFASQLRTQGITVNNVERISNQPTDLGETIFVKETPLEQALLRSNRDSHNMYAESLLKRIAFVASKQQGTFEDGARVVEKAVAQRLGYSVKSLNAADGSGMSRDNRVSPNILARWLASFNVSEPSGAALLQSMATVGTGTLRNRFDNVDIANASIHAKSGYLRGVCSLSGYIVFKTRPPIVFSILVNDVKGTVKGAKKMQEAIVSATIHNSL